MALVCSPELHLNVRNQLEMMKRDNMMGILMMRNKVTRDEWVMEALIVALELYLNTHKPDIKYVKFRNFQVTFFFLPMMPELGY